MKNPATLIRFNVPALLVVTAFAAIMMGCASSVTIRTAPPPLPEYDQPFCPGPGYLWIPGYWAYGPDGYFWVPGMWELSPRVGWMWTPGYWGWSDGIYVWRSGYWGSHVGFYGGVNYGYGYTGVGYEGGYWKERTFYYNSAVTNVNVAVVHTTYKQAVVNETATAARVSYNGGTGGIAAKPTSQELLAARERHVGLTANQKRHFKAAVPKRTPKQRVKNNRKVKRQD